MLNQIPRNTSTSPTRVDRLLSSFEIVRSQEYRRGRPHQQTRLMAFEGLPPSASFSAKLKNFRNWNGHWYAEDHVEEWVSRSPQALFPGRTVHVLASQNYAHLQEKIDLLFLDDRQELHVLEVKAEHVASNRGVPPDQIWGQMNRYVGFLRSERLPFPTSLENYYSEFSTRFVGSPHELASDLQQTFGQAFSPVSTASLVVRRTFLTEGYDDYAVDYFRACQQRGDGPIRLLYYRFCPEVDRHWIQFWEVLLIVHAQK